MSIQLTIFLTAIIAVAATGFIIVVVNIRNNNRTFRGQAEIAKEKEDLLIKGLLQALHDEIEIVFGRYQQVLGDKVDALNEDDPLLIYYPIISDFFTVYNGNASLIGRIPDHDLRRKIIKTYTLGKGLVDCFCYNNALLEKFETWNQIYFESKSDIHKQKTNFLYNSLVEYAKTLKLTHEDVKASASQLLIELEKEGLAGSK